MTKQQEFTLLKKYKDFELREYLPCVIAEVKVSSSYSSATSSAFRHLFGYISKGNKASEKIAMTAPVIAAQNPQGVHSNDWSVSFVMPSGSIFGDLPAPKDPNVILRELDSEVCVALSFRGNATQEIAEEKINNLRAAAEKENFALSEENRICRFDPPFKPGFMQYNEIVIPAFLSKK